MQPEVAGIQPLTSCDVAAAMAEDSPTAITQPAHGTTAPAAAQNGSRTSQRIGLAATQAVRAARWLGVDRAVVYAMAARVWQIGAGLLTVLFIARFLTPSQQGYYYTFFSVLALSVFFELGLGSILGTYAAHEMAHLSWTDRATLAGDPRALARLGSLLRMTTGWYAVIAALMISVVAPAGYWFFHTSKTQGVNWQGPWILLVGGSAAACALTPPAAILEGCGLVREVALLRLVQLMIGGIVAWTALAAGLDLYSTSVPALVGLLCGCAWLLIGRRSVLAQLWKAISPHDRIHWWSEVWPMQWKIALSWLSGYFIFQLFTPILMRYHGPIEAGRMGMSLSMANGLQVMAIAWMGTKMPRMAQLIARRDYQQLDGLFFETLAASAGLAAALGLSFWLAVAGLRYLAHPLAGRVLEGMPLALVLLTGLINVVVFAEAGYLRAHKQEPFLANSIVGAVATGVTTYSVGRWAGAPGMAVGNFILALVLGLGWGTWIFQSKRRRWHDPAATAPMVVQEPSRGN